MTEAKPTPGPWQPVIEARDGTQTLVGKVIGNNGRVVASEVNWLLDRKLIAEAGTVHHETGLTPRQLAEHLAELLEVLEGVADQMQNLRGDGASMRVKLLSLHAIARAAIARARGEG